MKRIFLLASYFMMGFASLLEAASKPTLSKIYATPYAEEILQYNDAGTQGALDGAFGTNGSLSLNTELANSQAKAIQVLSDGTFILALSAESANSRLVKYNAEGTVISTYGSSTGVDLGAGTAIARGLIVDAQGRIVVCGGDDTTGTAGWLKRVSSEGQTVTTFATDSSWQFIGGIAQQATGTIIAVGFNGTNAQIGRYNADLTLDYSFGNQGFIIFDGTNHLSSSTGLYSVILDQSNFVYVTYLDGTDAKAVSFDYDGNIDEIYWKGILSISYLNFATVNTMRVAFSNAGIIIGAAVSGNVKLTCINYSNSDDPTTFANFTTPIFDTLYGIVPTVDGKVLLLGSDTATPNMAVMRLTADGILDTSTESNNVPFNTTGYNLFTIGSPDVSSVLLGASVAPNGQLFAAGYQTNSATTIPYVSRLYNAPFVSAVAQFPVALEQGLFDTSFGTNATQSFRGVQMPYNGTFGGSLLQQTRGIVELISGDFLIGSDGYIDSSSIKTMMLTRLTQLGAFDTNFGSGTGKLTLPNVSTSDETMTALAVGSSGVVYVAGQEGTPLPFIRSYTSAGVAITSDLVDTGIASVGIAIQGSAGILLFAQDDATTGHISRYASSVGVLALDGIFGTDGKISTTDFGLNMGPVYGGGLVNRAQDIIIAYKNSSTGAINIAMINKNGTDLIPEFGTAGIALDVFDDTTIPASNIRIAFDTDIHENIYVAAVNADGTRYLITRLDGKSGQVDQAFNGGDILEIVPELSATGLVLTNLTGVSNGTVMLTGYDAATNPAMLTMRVASVDSVATLDSTFNSQGAVPGVVPMQIENETANYYARVATGLAIQSNSDNVHGNLIYTAYEQQIVSQSTPEIMRLFGASGTTQTQRFPIEDQYPGTLDISLNSCGAYEVDLPGYTANVVYAYPDGNDHEGKILIGFNADTNIVIIRVDEITLVLDVTFNPEGEVPGSLQINDITGLENIMVDVNNNIIINGTTLTPLGWAQRIPENADSDQIIFTMPSDITSAHMVYQQRSGRYIVVGSTSTVGTMVAFQDVVVAPATGLAIDETFNPLATGSSAGRWNISGSTALYSLAVNSDDTIYTAYKNTATGYLTIMQVLANGSGLDTAFGSAGSLSTVITPDSASVVRCAVDGNQSVIVAAACGSGTSLQAFRCDLTGGNSTQFTTAGIVTADHIAVIDANSLTTGLVLDALLTTENEQTILIGSNSSSANGTMFAVRLDNTGNFDATWNPDPTSPDLAGILTFGADENPLTPAITIMNNAAISVAGNIFAVGGNGENPVLMKIVGDSYVNSVIQGQFAGVAGIVDTTLAASGSLNLITSGLTNIAYTAKKLYVYPNGSMLIASGRSATTQLTKIDATLAFDSSFNSGAILSLGASSSTINDMFVADAIGQDGTIYVTGNNSGALWASTVSADGLTITNFAASTALPGWTKGAAIRVAANGNIIVAGRSASFGSVASFFPNGAALDPYFATAGVYATSSDDSIAAMTIDSFSRIYIAYRNSGDNTIIHIDRLTPAGIIDPLFTPITWTGTSWSSTQIKMVLDEQNNQLVLAAQDGIGTGNILKVARFSTVDSSSAGVSSAITIASKILSLSDLFIDDNQEIYVVGSNTNDNKLVIARLISTSATTITLDITGYAVDGDTPGIANVTAGLMISVTAGALNPDGRVYVVGSGSGIAYMVRLFGNNYFTQVSQAVSSSALGQLDYSYGTTGIATNYADGQTLPAAGQQARTIQPITTGSDILTIIGDGINAWTVRLLPDGTNDSTYASGEGIAIGQATSGDELVQGMVFDGAGNTIVFGSNSVGGGYVKSILSSGSMNTGFGGAGTNPTGTMYSSQFTIVNAVAQLSNGNYVIVGSFNGVGKLAMLNPFGIIDPLFTVQSFGTNVTSLSVDTLDNIYISYASVASSIMSANVAKLNATGSAVSAYGTNGIVTNIMTNLDSSANIRSVLDAEGKVVIAASGNGDAGSIGLRRLTLAGIIDPLFHSGTQLNISFDTGTDAVVTSLAALQNGNYYVAGYQYDSVDADNNDYEFVAAVTNSGSLDSDFNITGDVPGLLTFQVATGQQTGRNIWNMNVQDNGQILLSGSEGPQDGGQIPLTMRVNGYPGVKSIPQFTGSVSVDPSDIYSTFGISYTFPEIETLVDGGSTVVDSLGRVLIGGITSDHTFVVARFLANGTLDQDFTTGSYDGISETPILSTLRTGSFISLDSLDNVYIGGMTVDNRFMVAKFLGTTGNLDVDGFNSSGAIPGVTQSVEIPTLVSGGYTTVDYLFNVIVGGITSDHTLVVARFTTLGLQDDDFGTDGIAQTGVIPTLQYGGYVATDSISLILQDENNIYIGASTYDRTLMIACFDNTGVMNSSFGTSGIAATGMITNLSAGGPVALDNYRNIVVSGFTTGKTFVAAKFLITGIIDPLFSPTTNGITFSNALASLDSCAGIAIDNNDNILVGGISIAYDGVSKSMIVARWTTLGIIDPLFTPTGIATTGTVDDLVSGGFVATNALNNVFAGGYAGTRLVVGGLNSGAEIFISNPGGLPTSAASIFLYGNNPLRFKAYLGAEFFAENITNINVRNVLKERVNLTLDEYLLVYENQSNLNLAASTTPGWNGHFGVLEVLLSETHPDSAEEIAAFFVAFNRRRLAVNNTLAQYSRR